MTTKFKIGDRVGLYDLEGTVLVEPTADKKMKTLNGNSVSVSDKFTVLFDGCDVPRITDPSCFELIK